MAQGKKAAKGRGRGAAKGDTKWTKVKEDLFFFDLSQRCNVSKAMEEAGFGTSSWPLYNRLKKDPEFQARFDAAIAQGFALLELEMLERARHGDNRPAPATEAERKLRETATGTGLQLLRTYHARVKGTKPAASTQRPMKGAKLRDALERRLAEISRRLGGGE